MTLNSLANVPNENGLHSGCATVAHDKIAAHKLDKRPILCEWGGKSGRKLKKNLAKDVTETTRT